MTTFSLHNSSTNFGPHTFMVVERCRSAKEIKVEELESFLHHAGESEEKSSLLSIS
ncbi:hypothetical protein HPP92_027106 [Vanilla planifolia]|uniref:Uncharacterized protein n=1 Tax=Vanilla planifolia TaxID=51239 RepID=A0A835PAV8_VANPL|nr:hypothetical protein HPP92_027106 [Vanilla planifolia]